MTGKLLDQHLNELENLWQELKARKVDGEDCQSAWERLARVLDAVSAARKRAAPPPESPLDATGCEAILSQVFEASPDLISLIDRDLNVVLSNWSGHDYIPVAARRGRPKCYQVFHHRDRPCEVCPILQVFADGRPRKVESLNPIDGRVREIHSYPVRSQSGQVMLVVKHCRDITAQDQAQQALKESEERFRAIFATAPDAIFIKDRACRYTQVNPAMVQLLGRPADEIIGRTDADFFGREAAARIRQSDQRVLQGAVVKETQAIPVQAGPTPFQVVKVPLYDATGSGIVGICSIARDISDLKRTETALEEATRLFRGIFDNAVDGILLVDPETRQFHLANPAIAAMLGYSREELQRLGVADIHPADSLEYVLDQFQRQLQQEIILAPDIPVLRQDGNTFFVDISASPLHLHGKLYLIGIFRDITARKQAEAALQKSEAVMRTLVEANPESLVLMDTRGIILAASRVAAQRLGMSLEDMIGVEAFALFPPEVGQRRRAFFQQVLATGQPAYYDDARGDLIFSNYVTPILADGKVAFVSVLAVDITARKQAEAALRDSEERYRALFEASPDAIGLLDLEMNLIVGNRRGLDMFRQDSLDQGSRSSLDYVVPEDRERVIGHVSTLWETGRGQTFEAVMSRQDGTRFSALCSLALIKDDAGRPQYVFGVARDISGLKRTEAALRESEQRFRLMAETIQDVFWISIPPQKKFFYVSPAYEQVWGRPREELYANPTVFLEALHPDDRKRVRSDVLMGQTQGIPWNHEYRINKPDGTGRWIQDRGFPIKDEQGRVVMITGIATDITERKTLEQALFQAQKMEAVGRLAGGVAHDFNNLLMAITGYSELMRGKVIKGDPLNDYLEEIVKATDRAAALTQQLLTFSRRQITHPQVVDLNRIIRDLEKMLQRLIGEDIDLEITTDTGPVGVKADPAHLGQVIMNLVLNARDAMLQGGRLIVQTASVEVRPGRSTRFGEMPPGAYAQLVVRDTGIGMDDAIQAQIFDPFFTTKEPGKGTGLGLSMVYRIVRQSGGYIDLHSEPGAGTTFRIWWPRREISAAPSRVKAPLTAGFRGEETILLVEDEDMLRVLLAKFLRLYGYTVLEARHGGEALLVCERHQGPIHLLVTDVVMPQMSGRELAERLAGLRPEMAVLMMSGYTEDAMVQYGVADLTIPFLQKPFKPIELARKIHAVLHPPVPG